MGSNQEKETQHRSTRLWKFLTIISMSAAVAAVVLVSVSIPALISQVRDLRDQIKEDQPHWNHTRKTRQVNNAVGGASTCPSGPPGRDGRDGRDGIRGDSGPQGQMGPRGPLGPANPSAYVSELIDEILGRVDGIANNSRQCEMNKQITSATSDTVEDGGAVYVRWGRKTCSNSSELLYEGVVGGSHFAVAGGGANYLCLPLDPEWETVVNGHQGVSGIYGTEYQIENNPNMFSRANAKGNKINDDDVPCAVCLAESRPRYVMIPAKMTCPAGWTDEYKGYLMAANVGHKRSQYVCVDEAPETDDAGHLNKDGALFYFVEAYCGSLPCPNYKEGHELTCVACTK